MGAQDPGLDHRRFLDPAPGLRPMEEAGMFRRIGGQSTIDRLVDSLYDRFEADSVIRPTYVAALLHYGARVGDSYNGAMPMHYAVKAGFVATVRVLLEHGADPHALDDRGRTPIEWLDRSAKSVDRAAVRTALGSWGGSQGGCGGGSGGGSGGQ